MSAPTPAAMASAERALPWLWAVAAVLVSTGLLIVDPTAENNLWPPCPLHWLTGLYCPGCGATRALHALLHFDLARALAMNALLVLTLPVLPLIAWPTARWSVERGVMIRVVSLLRSPRMWLWLVLGFAVLRNLPWWPFVGLAPG